MSTGSPSDGFCESLHRAAGVLPFAHELLREASLRESDWVSLQPAAKHAASGSRYTIYLKFKEAFGSWPEMGLNCPARSVLQALDELKNDVASLGAPWLPRTLLQAFDDVLGREALNQFSGRIIEAVAGAIVPLPRAEARKIFSGKLTSRPENFGSPPFSRYVSLAPEPPPGYTVIVDCSYRDLVDAAIAQDFRTPAGGR